MPTSDAGSAERVDSKIPGAFPEGSKSQTSVATHQTLSQAIYERRAEYTRPRDVRIKVGTWNVAAEKGTEQDIGGWFVGGKGFEESLAGLGVSGPKSESKEPRESVSEQEARSSHYAPTIPKNDDGSVPAKDDIGLYVLGLQEVVDITSPTEALKPYTDPAAANRWKTGIQGALPAGYHLVAEQQLIGLLLLIYASPTVYPHVKSVCTTSVGTGLMGYMGNKGAVTARIVIGETTRLAFVNCHLAAGADKTALDRRNWDAGQIISRTRFDPTKDAMGITQGQSEGLGEEDFAFWFGDLNYRLEGMPGDDVRRLLTIHTRGLDTEPSEGSQDVSTASSGSSEATKTSSDSSLEEPSVPLPPELDPASLQTTISSLLPHDELHQQQKAGKAFYDGWEEGPIRFLPSYKYDIGKVGVFDSSEKRRCPSWCDRILYRTRAGKERYDVRAKEIEEAKKRDEEMKQKGMDHAGDDDEVLFDYDPETDGDNVEYDDYDENADPEPEAVVTKDGFSDEILLETYAAHMRVLSSDHKPLEAIFSLKYDAVIPELKATIHQEVARELDRQENEGRPSIAVVVDQSAGSSLPDNNDATDAAFDGVDFGDVQFAKSQRRNLTIANTGRVPATFGFTNRPVEEDQPEGAFPRWLTVTFDKEPDKPDKSLQEDFHQQYTLEPAEVCNVELKLKVEAIESVRSLNEGKGTIDEILVLRVHDGRDHFLPIRANWIQSALARTIDKLIKIPEGGIRKLQGQKPDCEQKVMWSVPREIFRLTEALEDLIERTLAEWDMMGHEIGNAPWQHNAGWPFVKDPRHSTDDSHEDTLAKVYEALDCDEPFDKAFDRELPAVERAEILANVLLQFLRSLQDGIVTKSLWEKLEEGIATQDKSKQQLSADDEKMFVLEVMSSAPNHNASFLLLTSMLQHIANEITNASKPDPKSPKTSIDLPASPQVSVRRKTLSKIPEVAVRQLINRNYVTVFVEAMFRSTNPEKLRPRERATRDERMFKVVELFVSDG